jgi:hypothetical protein
LCLNYVAATCFSRSRSSSGTCCNKTLLYVTNIISCDKKAVDVERDEATLNGGQVRNWVNVVSRNLCTATQQTTKTELLRSEDRPLNLTSLWKSTNFTRHHQFCRFEIKPSGSFSKTISNLI